MKEIIASNIFKPEQCKNNDLSPMVFFLQQVNHELIKTIYALRKENYELKYKLRTNTEKVKKEEKEKAIRKETRANRKRFPKRQPMTSEIYDLLIKGAKVFSSTKSPYKEIRLTIAICLLTVTGIRISQLLPLKVGQLQTLLQSYSIEINHSQMESKNIHHKAFLTHEGKKLVTERKEDFEFLFRLKTPDSYIFTSESNHTKMLCRETITRDVNSLLSSVSKSLPDQPNITSHSFRIGYISKLWKDTKDIEFVKQSVGHRKLYTTSLYVEPLSDQERQERTSQL